MKRLLPFLLLTSACTSLVPSTLLQLSKLSPVTSDPGGFAVLLALPEGLDILPDSAKILLTAERSDTGAASAGTYTLQRLPLAGRPAGLVAAEDAVLTSYRVNPADLDDFRAQQATIRAWEAENDAATSGAFRVTLEGCRIGAGPEETDKGSVYLRIEPDGNFLPLVRNAAIRNLLDAQDIADLAPCP